MNYLLIIGLTIATSAEPIEAKVIGGFLMLIALPFLHDIESEQ